MRAIVVDKDYGSVTPQELDRVAAAYQAAGIQMELLEYQVEATRQKEPTEEEIIAGCQGAQVLLATGNPPITHKVMETLPGGGQGEGVGVVNSGALPGWTPPCTAK